MTVTPTNDTAQIEEELDLDDFMPLASKDNKEADVSLSLFDSSTEGAKEQHANTEELFKMHDIEQHMGNEEKTDHTTTKSKKRVRFTEDVHTDDEKEMEHKKIKQEVLEDEDEEVENFNVALQPLECDVSAHSDSDDDEDMQPEGPHRSNKSFTMEVLVGCLMKLEQLLQDDKLEDAKTHVEYLLNKCKNRTSVRKRVEGKRVRKNIQGYVHIFCARRAIGFYSNSYEKPKNVSNMVHFITIKCAVKSDKADKMSSGNIVRELKKMAGSYMYRANDTPKKHMNVFKNKLEKCIKIINRVVQEYGLTVVYENSAWRNKLNELPDVQSEVSE